MADKFDAYREALVVEAETVWTGEFDDWDAPKRISFEEKLHDLPEEASQLEYIRTHTGFCRTITVTEEDVARLA